MLEPVTTLLPLRVSVFSGVEPRWLWKMLAKSLSKDALDVIEACEGAARLRVLAGPDVTTIAFWQKVARVAFDDRKRVVDLGRAVNYTRAGISRVEAVAMEVEREALAIQGQNAMVEALDDRVRVLAALA